MRLGKGAFLPERRSSGHQDPIAPAPRMPSTAHPIHLGEAVQDVISSWFGGDCVTASVLSGEYGACSDPTDPLTLKIQYESILGARVSLENCETASEALVRCDVHYSNALNEAVGKPAAVISRRFGVLRTMGARSWHEDRYPEDVELNESFQAFAEGGELSAEYAAAGCAHSFTPDCANLMMDNLDDWAAWYQDRQ